MKSKLFFLWSLITVALLAYAVYEAAFHAPMERTMFEAQRIFYYHVPAAATAFGLFIVNCIASIWYLWKRSPKADALAVAGAEVGVVFCGVVLITGPIWAQICMGHLLGMGRAPDHHAASVAALHELSDSAS